jgi:uncharacterized protein (TIRG00374 family)
MSQPETAPATPKRKRAVRLSLQIALFVAVVGAVFGYIVPKLGHDYGDIWETLRRLSWVEYLLLGLAAIWNIVTYWPMLVAAMPGLTLGQAAVVCQSSTAVAMTVPTGGALAVGISYAMYTSWGFSPSEVAVSAVVTWFANMTFKLAMPVVALALVVLYGEDSGGLVTAAIVGVVLMVAVFGVLIQMLRRETFARRVGDWAGRVVSFLARLVHRPPVQDWGDVAVRFRGRLVLVVRQRGAALATFEILSQLSLYLVLLATLRFVGIPDSQLRWTSILAVFAIVRLASAAPILPGNVGLVELGYYGGLRLAGGPAEEVIAAVLLFRFLTFFLQIPTGAVTYLIWRRNKRWRRPRQPTAPHEVQPPEDAREVDGPAHHHGRPGLAEHGPDREDEQPAVPSSQE